MADEVLDKTLVEEPQQEPVEEPPSPAPKRVIVSVTGNFYSYHFLKSWTQTIYTLLEATKKYDVKILIENSKHYSKMQTMGLDPSLGPDQVPFHGEVDYDIWLTINSNMVFSAEQVIALIESTEAHPAVSGIYRREDLNHFDGIVEWDDDFLIEHKEHRFVTLEEIEKYRRNPNANKFIPMVYSGLGFFACRREVLEAMKYPYFHHPLRDVQDKDGKVAMVDLCTEEMAFCRNLNAAGYMIHVNTDLRVGQENNYVV
jgi:hypothetical protein